MQWWITQKLKSRNSSARREAVRTIGEEGDPRHVQLLSARLTDRDVEVRMTAVRALANIRDEVVLPPLLAALKDPEASVREVCAPPPALQCVPLRT